MSRGYKTCNRCGWRRMRLIAKLWKTARHPEAPTEYHYRCPNCGNVSTYGADKDISPRYSTEIVVSQESSVKFKER